MHAFKLVAPIAGVSALLLLATFPITKSHKAAWSIFAVLTLTSLVLLAVSIHRMIVWRTDVNSPIGALVEPDAAMETKIFTRQQWVDRLWAFSDVTFWLFWPMVASNVLWITGGLPLLRRTRSGESASKGKVDMPGVPA